MSESQVGYPSAVVVTPEKGPPAKATLKVIAKAATTDKTKNNERFMKILHQSEFEFQYFKNSPPQILGMHLLNNKKRRLLVRRSGGL
jgi:hypothetical protein